MQGRTSRATRRTTREKEEYQEDTNRVPPSNAKKEAKGADIGESLRADPPG
jgi:hypothetical protein